MRQHRNRILLSVEHLIQYVLRNVWLEMVSALGVCDLLRVVSVRRLVEIQYATYKLQEKAASSTFRRDVGGTKTIGRQAADMVIPIQYENTFRPKSAGCYCCHYSAGICPQDDQIIGSIAGLVI